MSKTKNIKNQIEDLRDLLDELKDSGKIEEVNGQIKELEEQLPSGLWKKITAGLIIASIAIGAVLGIIEIVLIFL